MKKLTVTLITLLFCGIFFIGCEKDHLTQIKTNKDINYIENLVERALQVNITEEEYQQITREYEALNKDELESFDEISIQKNMILAKKDFLEKETKGSNINLETIQNDFEYSAKCKKEIREMSLKEYGKPANQLNNQELTKLLSHTSNTIDSFEKGSCSIKTYPYSSKESYNYDTDCSGYSKYATPGDPYDCDYEFRFSGKQYKVYGTNWFAKKLINHWGGKIARRKTSLYTRLLFGQKGVWFWVGSPSFTKNKLKMK